MSILQSVTANRLSTVPSAESFSVSLSPSVIHHVISAYTSSRLVINYACNFNTFNLHSVCNFQLLTH